MTRALEGITILDLSRVLAGPFCTMILGDLGADVIKVEHPLAKDETRAWGPPYTGGESAYYLCANRNKRGITINLNTDAGREVLRRLLLQSDVVVQNFKASTVEKLGLSYEAISSINPRIISASITGFGLTGPYKDEPGYDYIIQAMAGLMSITGDTASGPMKVGVAIADILTGLYTVIGILAALQERHVSGKGQQLDISLFDSQISALVNVASNYLVSGVVPRPLGNQHPNIVPYQVFPTRDQDLVVAVGNDSQFRKLTQLMGMPELSEQEKFATNPQRLQHRDELVDLLGTRFRERPAAEWRKLLGGAGIPNGPIQDLKSLFADPQVQAREMVVEVPHPTAGSVPLVGSPLKLSRTPVSIRSHPPLCGEHTHEVLRQLGYSEQDIEQLQTNQII